MTTDTHWRQVEPRARKDFTRTDGRPASELRAEIHDPLWMLGRQWQLREFQGEDAGSPIGVEVTVARDELAGVELLGDDADSPTSTAIDYDGGPLEPLVEREPVLAEAGRPNGRLAAEAGLHFLRLLALGDYPGPAKELTATDFPERLRLAVPEAHMDARSRRYFEVMTGTGGGETGDGGRVLDGRAVYDAIEASVRDVRTVAPGGDWKITDESTLPLPDGGTVNGKFRRAVARYVDWYHTLYAEPTSESGSAWVPDRMEYRFRASTGAGDSETVFEAREYEGGHLDWDAFSVVPGATLGDGGSGSAASGSDDAEATERTTTETVRTVPTQVKFPGMPSTRWWELEDAGVSLDDIAVDGHGLPQLVLVEFAAGFGNDWFQFPLETEVGTLNRITSLTVTDTFGVPEDADPAVEFSGSGASGPEPSAPVDGWNLFGFDLPGGPGLFLPPTLAGTLDGEPAERVVLARDELANLAFGIEELAEGPAGRPVDRTEFRRPRLTVRTVRPDADPAAEFVEFSNPGDDRLDVTGLVVERESSESDATPEPVYTFEGTVLGPGGTLRLYTGPADDPDARSAGRSASVWSGPDTASLTVRDADGRVVVKHLFGTPDPTYPDWRLATDVPDYWFPFTMELADGEDYRLVRSILLDASTLGLDPEHLPRPAGKLLVPPGEADLRLHEEELPGGGREIERRYQYTRWTDGRGYLWVGRRARPGRGDAASGLRFDVLEDPSI
jgi:hypothetical protein